MEKKCVCVCVGEGVTGIRVFVWCDELSIRGYWVAVGLLYTDCGEQAVRFEGDICCSCTHSTHSLDI